MLDTADGGRDDGVGLERGEVAELAVARRQRQLEWSTE
jgi:hypothetical protein